jgi:ABC-type proline/glycine betaine transport system permease subunit
MSWGTEGWGLIALGGLLAYVSNVFYMWGGTDGFSKIWRRFVGASLMAFTANFVGLFEVNWHWQYLTFFPFLIVGFSLGYGAKTAAEKILKRTLYCVGIVLCCVFGMWASSFSMASITVMILSILVALTSVALGVLNPFKSARLEEFLVSQVMTMFIPFWALVK